MSIRASIRDWYDKVFVRNVEALRFTFANRTLKVQTSVFYDFVTGGTDMTVFPAKKFIHNIRVHSFSARFVAGVFKRRKSALLRTLRLLDTPVRDLAAAAS